MTSPSRKPSSPSFSGSKSYSALQLGCSGADETKRVCKDEEQGKEEALTQHVILVCGTASVSTASFKLCLPVCPFPSDLTDQQSGAPRTDKLGFFVTKQFSHCIKFTQQTAGQARDGESFAHSPPVLYPAPRQSTENIRQCCHFLILEVIVSHVDSALTGITCFRQRTTKTGRSG